MEEIDKKVIAGEVRRFQYEIWQRADLTHSTVPHLLQLFRPDHAARVHGYEYEVVDDSLGIHGVGKDRYQVAGLVDPANNIIKVAGNLSYEVQRFTAAHEIGHMVLHPGMSLHRDRPLTGEWSPPDKREREANFFAACFLAPEKMVRQAFEARFHTTLLHLDDTVAFYLVGSRQMQDLLRSETGSLEFARAVATAKGFGLGNYFKPLNELFGMSPTAMAIRLVELGLVANVIIDA
ncbi:ImmA/IrrE family metallo-endopeptidase [Burkholderia cepacia]|uniref:ImmA/IrrE family metallo-endopeptidase n=1 Tax=Burkholderia cepacia TaxID=292 RepID=UPI00158E398C|nr:ImmA/IrrE family metallo-endopeptidase [Burkholderia cepacia]